MKKFKLPFITIAAGTIFQLFILYSYSFLQLLTNLIPDDSFYYFQTARNIVNGCGSTMDCVNLSNGYHPLWMLILLPIFKFFSVGGTNDLPPIYTALTLEIFLSAVTAYLLYKILSKYTENQKIISFGIFIYLFNPNLIYNVLNGLETSLVLFCLALFIYFLKSVSEKPTRNNLIYLGLSGGLLSLARLDMAIVVGVSYLFLLQTQGGLYRNLNNFFISALTTGIIFVTWMIYNFEKFGMLFTSASVASTFINHRLTYSDNGGESAKLFIKTIFYMLERATQQIVADTGAPIIILMLFGVGIYFVFKSKNFFDYKNLNFVPEVFVTLGIFALIFVSAGLRWTFRGWYFMPLLLIWSIFIVWILDNLFKEFKNSKAQNIFLLILTLAIAYSFFITWTKNLSDNQILQKTMYQATMWQNQNLPTNAHIGTFNSGIQAYFSKHRVTNLDGLINDNAADAMLDNTLWQYMTNIAHLDYVSDFDSYMIYRYKDSFRDANGKVIDITASTTMEKIYTIPGPKDLNIYKIKY